MLSIIREWYLLWVLLSEGNWFSFCLKIYTWYINVQCDLVLKGAGCFGFGRHGEHISGRLCHRWFLSEVGCFSICTDELCKLRLCLAHLVDMAHSYVLWSVIITNFRTIRNFENLLMLIRTACIFLHFCVAYGSLRRH